MKEQIRQFVTQQPFEPFEIELANGRVLRIMHPEFVAVPPARTGLYFAFAGDQAGELINTMLVVAVRPIKKNGKYRKAG